MENEQKPVILQMDPESVYRTYRSYYLTVPIDDVNLIAEQYNMILSDTEVLDEFNEVSGFDCDQHAIKEVVDLSFSTISSSTVWSQYGLKPVHAKVSLSAKAPCEEIGEALMSVIDAHVMALQENLVEEYARFSYEKPSASNQFGYDSGVRSAQEASTEALKAYGNEIIALEEELTDDDMFLLCLDICAGRN